MHRFVLIFSLSLLGVAVSAQTPVCPSGKEGDIWFFGDHIGLDFNTQPPTVLTNVPINTYEASTIVSDANGNLLFYSDGEYVWDRNYQRMPAVNPAMGGSKLKGNESSTQIIAVPLPGSSGIYYLFYPETADNVVNTPADTLRKMYYSIIDLSQNGGLGDVIDKDHFLFERTTEKVAVTKHCNGEDWWILTAESGSNRYFVWSLTNSGLNMSPVINLIGRANGKLGATKGGILKLSPNAKQLLKIGASRVSLNIPWTLDCYVELLEFNNATGLIYNPVLIIDSVRHVYGAEFSPDNTKLYFNHWTPWIDSLYQYDMCVYHPDSIRASKTPIDKAASNTGQLQLGPDGKIYLSSAFNDYISIIHQPNLKGTACQYEKQAITFPSGQSLLGLPTFPASYYAPGKPYLATTGPRCAPLCRDSVQQYYVTGSCVAGAQYTWSAVGGTVVQQVQDTAWVRWQQAGVHEVRVRKVWDCGDRSDTLRVEVKSCAPCEPMEVELSATTCVASEAGVDTVVLTTVAGCDSLVITTTAWQPPAVTLLDAMTCSAAAVGVDTMFLLTGQGCDSLVVTTTTLSGDCAPVCPSGKEGNYWFFGDSVGLNFNTQPPTVLTGIPFRTYEASTIMSDASGNLLFYSNGEYVWDRNHQRMPAVNPTMGGSKLKGHRSATQIIALQQPGNNNMYYLFYPETGDGISGTAADTLRKMYYSIIDMSQNGGLGDVIDKDHILFEKTAEKIAATQHCNGEDWWILTTEAGSNRYFTWFLSSTGLSNMPIISSVGKTNGQWGSTKGGTLNFSSDGSTLVKVGSPFRSIAIPWSMDGYIEILEFNPFNGLIFNPTIVVDSVRHIYGAQFSPDGTKLYFNYWTPIKDSLFQVDLCVYHPDSIRASKTAIAEAATNTGQFQIGPDEKIYVSCAYQPYMSVIHQPNEKGIACQYEKQAINFPVGRSLLGLPTFPASYYAPGKPYLATTGPRCAPLCRDSVQQYYVTGSCVAGAQYTWSATGGTVVQQVQDTAWVQWQQAGTHEVRVRKVWDCGDRSDTLRVEVKSCAPCEPVEVELSATTCVASEAGVDTVVLTTVAGCDSLVITTTVLLPSVQTELSATTCDPALAGVDTLQLMTMQGCDSLVITTTVLVPSVQTELNATTCDPALAGVDTLQLMTTQGCDSLVITTTVLIPSVQTELSATTCDPALAVVDTLQLTTTLGCDSLVITTTVLVPSVQTELSATTCDPALAGVDTLQLTTTQGCDSLVITTTVLVPSVQTELSATTCDPALAGVDTLQLMTTQGCDSLVITRTVLVPSVQTELSAVTCDPALAGVDTLQLMTMQGCDSLVITTTVLVPSVQTELSAVTCDPALAGVDTLQLTTTQGCDSLVITTTVLVPSVQTELSAMTCDPALAGVDTLQLTTMQGCDSLVITTTVLLPSVQTELSAVTCNPALAGVDTLQLATMQGCDSLVITTTVLVPSVLTQLSAVTCDPALAGVDTLQLTTVQGCDSLVITTTILVPSVQTQLSAVTCDPALAGVDTLQLTTTQGCDSLVITTTILVPSVQTELGAVTCDPALAGVDTLQLTTTQGCDSLVITTTVLAPSVQTELSATTCDPALAGVDTLQLATVQGCDSLVITTTVLIPSVQTELSTVTCDPALAGVDTLQLTTMQGCDSLVITTTVLVPSVQTELSAMTCDPALAGVDTLQLTTKQGCDSLVITTTVLVPSVQTELSAVTCDPALVGVDTLQLTTTQGCDSLVITTTVLVPSVQTELSAVTCDPALAGVDTVQLTTMQGCDSLVITTTTLLPVVTEIQDITVCPGSSYSYGGMTLHAGDEHTFVLQSVKGCDSLVQVRVSAFPQMIISWASMPSCPQLPSGSLEGSVVSGGLPPFETALDSGAYQPGLWAEDLFAGIYTVRVRDAQGCRTDTEVTVGNLPEWTLQLPAAELPCEPGSRVELVAQVAGWTDELTYQWSTGAVTPAIEVGLPGLYSVTVSNICQTEHAEAMVTEASTSPGDPVYAPNVFWPASEQELNRTFRPFFRADVQVRQYRFRVYDRWGSQVFDTRDPDRGWDGMTSGRTGVPGVYIWLAEMDWEECGREVHWQGRGDVLLVR